MQNKTENSSRPSSIEDRISLLEEAIAGLKDEVKGNSKKTTSEDKAKRPVKTAKKFTSASDSNDSREKLEEVVSDGPTVIDLAFKDDGKDVRRIFGKTVMCYPLYEGERPERCNMLPVPLVNMHICNRTGWERMLLNRISTTNPLWKRGNRKLLYIPGCTAFIDEQRAVAWSPKTQCDTKQNFSLRSLFDTFYDKTFELFYDNGLLGNGGIFYAGTYRCHPFNDLHPSGLVQAGKEIPWTLTCSVMNSQERAFGQQMGQNAWARLIAAGDVTFEAVALQCTGFDMGLYCALTGDEECGRGSGHPHPEVQEETAPALEGKSTNQQKRRREELTSDEEQADTGSSSKRHR